MKITAVIPVRKGSQRVPSKNLRPFANTTILEIKIKTLKEAGIFDDIVVNTDSEEAIQIAIANGISYHRRDEYYASSVCTGSDFFEHLGLTTNTEVFAYCPSTSPFISIHTMKMCVKKYLSSHNCDSVATVSDIKEFLWLDGKPLNYDKQNAPNSQNLPNIQALNFGFTLIDRSSLIKNKNIIGDSPLFISTKDIESIDIDTELDFYIAEQIYIKTVLENKPLLDKI